MKKLARVLAAILCAAGLVMPHAAYAHETNRAHAHAEETTVETTAVDAASGQGGSAEVRTQTGEMLTPEQKKLNREKRLQEYKEKRTTKLTAAQEQQLKAKCQGAQVVTQKLVDNAEKVKTLREAQYGKVSSKLTQLVERLKMAKVETAEIEKAVSGFSEQSTAFLTAIDSYKTTLDDLSEMECATDPVAFRAALEEAKTQRVALVKSSQDLRKYYNETIKPALQVLRAKLVALEGDDSNESSTANESTEQSPAGEGQQ